MSNNEKHAGWVREMIAEKESDVEEKKMFGGLCFMVNDKMCVGVKSERLMFRIDPALFDEVLEKEGSRAVEMQGRIMKGYVYVDTVVLNTKKKLEYWVKLALDFNKTARSSKKKPVKKKK